MKMSLICNNKSIEIDTCKEQVMKYFVLNSFELSPFSINDQHKVYDSFNGYIFSEAIFQ